MSGAGSAGWVCSRHEPPVSGQFCREPRSVLAHGLDWTRMEAARGIAGSTALERDGVLCARTKVAFIGGPADDALPASRHTRAKRGQRTKAPDAQVAYSAGARGISITVSRFPAHYMITNFRSARTTGKATITYLKVLGAFARQRHREMTFKFSGPLIAALANELQRCSPCVCWQHTCHRPIIGQLDRVE
jgi:hypothetical protein